MRHVGGPLTTTARTHYLAMKSMVSLGFSFLLATLSMRNEVVAPGRMCSSVGAASAPGAADDTLYLLTDSCVSECKGASQQVGQLTQCRLRQCRAVAPRPPPRGGNRQTAG